MLAGKDVLVQSERTKIGIVLQVALRKLPIAGTSPALIGKVEVFRKRVGFVPGPGSIFMGTRSHFGPIEGLGGKKGQDSIGRAIKNRKGLRIAGKLMSVDQAAVGLVECVRRYAVVRIKFLTDRWSEPGNQSLDLSLRGLVSGNRTGAGKSRDPLPEGVARNVASHVLRWIKEVRGRVPAAKVFTGSRKPRELAERFEHAVLVHFEEKFVILLELHEHRTVEELDILVVELGKRRCGCNGRGPRVRRVRVAKDCHTRGECRATLEKLSTVWSS